MKEENRKTEEGMEEELGEGSTVAEDDNYELEAQSNNGRSAESKHSLGRDQAQIIIALCSKSNGRCDIKAEKREELESKSSHKSDIWLPAASKK